VFEVLWKDLVAKKDRVSNDKAVPLGLQPVYDVRSCPIINDFK
jgi:hypothetical protein